MANPKRKISKSKRDKRRARWMGGLTTPNFSECPNCGELKLPHRACPECGYYKGQKLFGAEE
ncbi:50S ribosomal protein L32 [Candidatus Saccharibacteria bacterium]|nr:50S ribosomal protein L32 [Candidatus Saccharibacteria bacterium]NIW78322.1 50S ribosomal protein L32 [Calditrichia bacterium]